MNAGSGTTARGTTAQDTTAQDTTEQGTTTRGTTTLGRLVLVSAPSGAGKTTLVKALLERDPSVRFSVSYTTRPARETETHGRDYYFVTPEEFAGMQARGAFLEHAVVFGHRYGTGASEVQSLRERGYNVLLEIDWQGARQVRRAVPDAVSVFVLPPGLETLEARLRGRETDSEEVIARRLEQALGDMSHWGEFDHVIVNDDLETAVDEFAAIAAGSAAVAATGDASVRRRVRAILESG